MPHAPLVPLPLLLLELHDPLPSDLLRSFLPLPLYAFRLPHVPIALVSSWFCSQSSLLCITCAPMSPVSTAVPNVSPAVLTIPPLIAPSSASGTARTVVSEAVTLLILNPYRQLHQCLQDVQPDVQSSTLAQCQTLWTRVKCVRRIDAIRRQDFTLRSAHCRRCPPIGYLCFPTSYSAESFCRPCFILDPSAY